MRIKAGQANPAPPVGSILGQHGVQLQEFCTKFNDATKPLMGKLVTAHVTIYDDRTFDFRYKLPAASDLIKEKLGISKGSKEPNKTKIGSITQAQLREIAEYKMPDLNAYDVESAAKIIAGTAKSMGLTIAD